jgi:hypothetical protein
MPNFLPLITHLFTSVSTPHFNDPVKDYAGLAALEGLGGSGVYSQEDVQKILKGYEDLLATIEDQELRESLAPSLNIALACGTSANALCALFCGPEKRTKLETPCPSLDALKLVVQDGQHRLIRIDIGSHSYVIEQVDTRDTPDGALGNVYQSNIAVYGYVGDRGCTVQDFLGYYTNPIDLVDHIDKVKRVGTLGPAPERYALYKELYVTRGFLERNDEEKVKRGFTEAHGKGALDGEHGHLQVKRISWTNLNQADESRAVRTIKEVLAYHPDSRSEVDAILKRIS